MTRGAGVEADLERACMRRTKAVGGLWLKFLPWLTTGFPDRLLLLPEGYIVFVETKAPRGRMRPRQAFWQRTLLQLGFRHRVIRSMLEFDALLDEYHHWVAGQSSSA